MDTEFKVRPQDPSYRNDYVFSAPWEPDDTKWLGLAREIVKWLQMSPGKWEGWRLYMHLRASGVRIPNWLKKEIKDDGGVVTKANVAMAIYKAMLVGGGSHSSCPGYEDEEEQEG